MTSGREKRFLGIGFWDHLTIGSQFYFDESARLLSRELDISVVSWDATLSYEALSLVRNFICRTCKELEVLSLWVGAHLCEEVRRYILIFGIFDVKIVFSLEGEHWRGCQFPICILGQVGNLNIFSIFVSVFVDLLGPNLFLYYFC